MKNFTLTAVLIGLTFLSGCLDSDVPNTSAQLALDIQKIEKYLDDNNITDYTKDETGVFYTIEQAGTGKIPVETDYVNLTYVAKLMNGTTAFEQTSIPVFLTVRYINVAGLRIALPKLAEGSIATVYVPSVLAYGTGSSDNIPANSILIFEINLLNVVSTTAEILEVQKTTIDNYVSENAIAGVQTDPSGLRYVIEEEGTGAKPTLENSIKVTYTGTLLSNGLEFSPQATGTFVLGGDLIQGWKVAFPLLPEGTKAKLFIPSGLGYGIEGRYNASDPARSIPSHAILVFDVDLLEVL